MKGFYSLMFTFLGAVACFGQLPDGSIAPNFTTQTISQQPYDLYSILDAGKPVVIDVSAAWCGPCWNYHNGHALANLYDQYGPQGTNELDVLFIEGDPQMAVECLYAAGACNSYRNSLGDWVTGTPYPIVDDGDGSINDAYSIGYFPTVYLVCPDRTIQEVGQLTAAAHYTAAKTCKVAAQGTDAGISAFKSNAPIEQICDEVKAEPTFYLINYGSAPLTSATLTLSHNGQVLQTQNWTGSLATYGNQPIAFNEVTLTEIGDLVVAISSVNGGAVDADPADNTKLVTFVAAPEADKHQVLVKVRTDQYGAETYWELRASDGSVISKGGNEAVGPDGGGQFQTAPSSPTAYGNNQTFNTLVDLPAAGCYLLHVVDAFGDGLCCDYGAGYVRLFDTDNLTTPLFGITTFQETVQRVAGTSATFSGIEDLIASNQFSVYPNPTSTALNLDFTLQSAAEVGIKIVNSLGQIVSDFAPSQMVEGRQMIAIPVNSLPNGLYHITLVTNQGLATRAFTVTK